MADKHTPMVTVAVPNRDQGRYLDAALHSIFQQDVPVEVFLADGGSTDNSNAIIIKWQKYLAGWRSHIDVGQSAAVNECISQGEAPYVSWLNSDDRLLPDGLSRLLAALEENPLAPAAFGKVYNECKGRLSSIRVEPFNERRLAVHCIVSQPGVLIRRSAWEAVGGLRNDLRMAMDYDLWWRLYRAVGPLVHVNKYVAVNLDHPFNKTNSHRRRHYQEAMAVVKQHYGRVPLKWWIAQPYAIWFRAMLNWYQRRRAGPG